MRTNSVFYRQISEANFSRTVQLTRRRFKNIFVNKEKPRETREDGFFIHSKIKKREKRNPLKNFTAFHLEFLLITEECEFTGTEE